MCTYVNPLQVLLNEGSKRDGHRLLAYWAIITLEAAHHMLHVLHLLKAAHRLFILTGAPEGSAANETGTGKASAYDWAIITGGSPDEQTETGGCRTGRPGPDEQPNLGGKCDF